MTYCTKSDMVDRFTDAELVQLTDVAGIGLIDDAVLNEAIDDAAAEIDSYLVGYTLPLDTVPPRFKRMACDIVRYFLYGNAPTDEVAKRFNAAIDYLERVASGDITLMRQAQASGNVAVIESNSQVFEHVSY